MISYDNKFNKEELAEIKRLRDFDSRRKLYSWLIGITVLMLVFLAQLPFHGVDIVHAICSFGCIPAGVIAGIYFYIKTDEYINEKFVTHWDQLYYERSEDTAGKIAAREAINLLLDQPDFYTMPKDKQEALMRQINEKYKNS